MRSLIKQCSEEELGKIVKKSSSYAECLHELGYVAITGVLTKQITVRIAEFGIDTSHFEQRKPAVPRNKENVFVENASCTQKVLRSWYLKEPIEYRCTICGQEPFWNGQEMIMILDHINGKNRDNRLENLRWVCPNCNSQLPTTNGKNIKNKHKVERKYFCSECGKPVTKGRKMCNLCLGIKNRKVNNRPSAIEFAGMVKEMGFANVGKKYGISGRAAQKWCDEYYHIPHRKEELIAWYNAKMGIEDPIKKKKKKKGNGSGEVPPPKPVKQIDPKTNKVVNIFSSINDAARAVNGNHTNISRVCNGERNTAYKYKWAFVQ